MEMGAAPCEAWARGLSPNRFRGPSRHRPGAGAVVEKRLHFIYYDLTEPIRWWFGGGRKLSLQAYYVLWQWRAVRICP
jgi:hypothetical protein